MSMAAGAEMDAEAFTLQVPDDLDSTKKRLRSRSKSNLMYSPRSSSAKKKKRSGGFSNRKQSRGENYAETMPREGPYVNKQIEGSECSMASVSNCKVNPSRYMHESPSLNTS